MIVRPRAVAASVVSLVAASLVGLGPPALATPVEAPSASPGQDGDVLAPPPVVQGLAPGEKPTTPPNIGGWPGVGAMTAASYLALDRDSGTVLAARQADRLRSVASTVKMLTAVTARRLEPDLRRTLVAGSEVADLEGSGVGITTGERWTVRELLEGMLVRSGNDAAAVVAAQLLPGGREAFLREMRADAERLGLDGAVLVSPSGLDDANQLSAGHLATIALELLADPVLAEIVDRQAVRLPDLGAVPNRNELVLRDPSVVGVKTGFTDAAGWSLVAAARRDGRTTVAVVLAAADDERRFAEAARLLAHADAFTSLPSLTPVEVGCPGRRVRAVPAATAVLVPEGAADDVEVAWPPRDCPGSGELVVTPTLQRLPLEPVEVAVTTETLAAADQPAAALGRWVAASAQRAMRALPPATQLATGVDGGDAVDGVGADGGPPVGASTGASARGPAGASSEDGDRPDDLRSTSPDDG